MNTTNVFVELLVIGLGPVTALVLVALLVLGPSTLPIADVIEASSSLAFLVPMLAATYVLGIVVDRLADWAFGLSASGRIRREYFPTDQAYHDSRRTILIHAEPIDRLRQYGRSRMRICRGWTVNATLLALPANLKIRGGSDFLRRELGLPPLTSSSEAAFPTAPVAPASIDVPTAAGDRQS